MCRLTDAIVFIKTAVLGLGRGAILWTRWGWGWGASTSTASSNTTEMGERDVQCFCLVFSSLVEERFGSSSRPVTPREPALEPRYPPNVARFRQHTHRSVSAEPLHR